MESKNYLSTVGTGSLSLETMGFIAFLVFLILKTTGKLDWDWFWIFFPLWAPLAIGFGVILIVVFILFLVVLWEERQ